MFGDREAYLNKFKTCARTRELGSQNLGAKFFTKEHTKPLFKMKDLTTVYNLYFYHCVIAIANILKFRTPISLFSLFEFSKRIGKETLIYLPSPSDSFVYRLGKIWNTACSKLKITSFTFNINHLKSSLKRAISKTQNEGDSITWNTSINCIINNFGS